ncbi:hypothetical protein C6P40_000256, partial [Pichia californica]
SDLNKILSNENNIDEKSNHSSNTKNEVLEDNITAKVSKKPITPHPELTLNLKHLRDINQSVAVSPTDILFGPKLKFLDEISIFYEDIRKKVYRMMETDSLGKFLESNEFKENYSSF